MRKFVSALAFTARILLVVFCVALPHFLQAQKPDFSDPEIRKARRELNRKDFERSHSDSTGRPRPDLLQKGLDDAKRLKIAAGVGTNRASSVKAGAPVVAASLPGAVNVTSSVTGVQWTQIGPAPLVINANQNFQGNGPDSGQMLDIAIDPRNTTDQVIYVATNGGVWKTTDGGTTWKPKTDFLSSIAFTFTPSTAIGALALDPSNPSIVYAGTGNDFNNNGRNYGNIGVLRSTDGGDTWTLVGNTVLKGKNINRMVAPAANVLLVGTTAGLYRSADGGTNFGSNAPLFNNGMAVLPGYYISDLHLDTQTASTVYAAADGIGIFQSIDSGATFTTNLFTVSNGAPTTNFGFITFAQSTTMSGSIFYASIEDTTNYGGSPPTGAPFKGIYRSTDSGANWTQINNASVQAAGNNCQCNYDQTIGVDPKDETRVYIGFQDLWVSTNATAAPASVTFSMVDNNAFHDDNHALVFSPLSHPTGSASVTQFYVGTDGGIAKSNDGSSTWSNINGASGTPGIATDTFRSIDIGRRSSGNNMYTFGGSQDTGLAQRSPGDAGTDWHLHIDGDGGAMIVDPSDPHNAYSNDDGIFSTTTTFGASWNTLTSAGSKLPDCGKPFVGSACASPIAVDPNNSMIVYATANTNLFKSSDQGVTFASIKDFSPQSISTIGAITQIDSNTMWLGMSDGSVRVTNNLLSGGSATWTTRTVTGAPSSQSVSAVAVDPTNTAQAAVVYPGFCGGVCAPGASTRHVFTTADSGMTWTDISGTGAQNLPDLPLHSTVIDPGTTPHTVIVSSDAGVMRTADSGASWQILGVGLPVVDSVSLALDSSASPALLRIGTYGRSAYELTSASGPLIAVNANLAFGVVCLGSSATAIVQIFNVGSTDLHISSFSRVAGSPDFTIISGPGTPVTVIAGEEIDFTIQFKPTAAGNEMATFQINSDDPFQPSLQLPASGTGNVPKLTTLMADLGNFGNVCQGSFKDLSLTLANGGCDTLSVTAISSNNSDFKVASVVSFPITIAAGTAIEVPIRYQPTAFGSETANITVTASAPADPSSAVIPVSGNAPVGTLQLTGSGAFGNVCAGTLAQQTIGMCNVGACDLHVTGITSGCMDFTLVNPPTLPLTVSPDSCVNLTDTFTPTMLGMKTCTLKVTSDTGGVVGTMTTLSETGNTPSPSIDVPTSFAFPPTVIQSVGACTSSHPFPVSNTGTCNLTINSITVGGTNAGDFSLSGLPSSPIILQAGHIAGEGNLKAVFAPTALSRNRLGNISVNYVNDPIMNTTATITPAICGEGDRTGARVLVTAGGVPLATVDKIMLQRITGNRNKPIVNTVDTAMNLPLTTVIPTAPCPMFQYHHEYGTVSNPIQLLPGSYVVTVQATVNKKKQMQTVAFDVNTCGFNPNIVVGF